MATTLSPAFGWRCNRLLSRKESLKMRPLSSTISRITKGTSFSTVTNARTTTATRFGITCRHARRIQREQTTPTNTRTVGFHSFSSTRSRFCISNTKGNQQHCQRLFAIPKSTGAVRSKSSSSVSAVEAPSRKTLRWVAFTTGLPFIGFGFMDNAILIVAGDVIDTSLGVTLGISTLCAAAIGNIVSDLAGIGCAASIENFCATTLKMPVPKLSSTQRQLRSVRMASQGGMAIGMTIGCILGMVPLLFIDANKADRLREKARLERLYKDVLNEAKSLVEAESTCLYLRVDKDDERAKRKKEGVEILPDYHPSVSGEYLYAMYYVDPHDQPKTPSTKDKLIRMVSSGSRGTPLKSNSGGGHRKSKVSTSVDEEDVVVAPTETESPSPHPTRVIQIGKGIVSRAVLTGTTWNIAGNLMDEPDFYPRSMEFANRKNIDPNCFRDLVVVPILDGKGRVIAVLEALNKEGISQYTANSTLDNSDGGFTDQDVEILMSLASHVSVSLQRVYQDGTEEEEEFGRLRDTIRILKEGKGIKRSITRRKSIAGENQTTTTTTTTTTIEGSSSTAARKKTRLFPE